MTNEKITSIAIFILGVGLLVVSIVNAMQNSRLRTLETFASGVCREGGFDTASIKLADGTVHDYPFSCDTLKLILP